VGDNLLLRIPAGIIAWRWLSGRENGNEGMFGGPTWWAAQRPLHGVLWGMYALSGKQEFLQVDTATGAINWLLQSGWTSSLI
jgi:hypothetical protein